MSDLIQIHSLLILLIGGIIVFSIFLRSELGKFGLPSVVGYLILGVAIRLLDGKAGFLSDEAYDIFRFLSQIGVIVLLFRVGLESNIKGLLRQFRRASIVWTGDVVVSGSLGFVASRFILGLDLVPSLILGVALVATSVGISISVWQEMKAMNSPTGELLLDVAEMDDISGIILLALLFSVIPTLNSGIQPAIASSVGKILIVILLKFFGFALFCLLFSIYIEKHITNFFSKLKRSPDPMLMITGVGFGIAAIAGLLGFSIAIGAFFAGLVFSRDPKAVKLDTSFSSLYEFFMPFFFIHIGLHVHPGSLSSALGLGSVLLIVAILGKLIGNGVLSLSIINWRSSLLFSMSMIPRAEIALVVIQRGREMGMSIVSDRVYSGMVVVSIATCILSPLLLRFFLKKWPQR